jgi:hypothetical protein
MKKILLLCLMALFTASCAHTKLAYDPSTAVVENEPQGISLRTVWLKNKDKSIDLMVYLTNHYSEDVTIKNSSWVLGYNTERFAMKDSSGDITLRAGLTQEKILIFGLPENERRSGEVTLTVDPITKEKDGKPVKKITVTLPISTH